MTNTTAFRRTTAAVCLLVTALLMGVSVLLEPEFPATAAERLAAVDAAGGRATLSAFAFTLAQLPFIVGVMGIGHLIRHRAPVLSNLGTSLAVVGGFGHAVVGGLVMTQLTMAADEPNRLVHAATVDAVESSPTVVFMAMGLLGTVLGLLLLGIGLWRARTDPRWVGPTLGAFLVVEFVGTSLTEWATALSGLLYLACFAALALALWRTSDDEWAGRRDVASAVPAAQ